MFPSHPKFTKGLAAGCVGDSKSSSSDPPWMPITSKGKRTETRVVLPALRTHSCTGFTHRVSKNGCAGHHQLRDQRGLGVGQPGRARWYRESQWRFLVDQRFQAKMTVCLLFWFPSPFNQRPAVACLPACLLVCLLAWLPACCFLWREAAPS